MQVGASKKLIHNPRSLADRVIVSLQNTPIGLMFLEAVQSIIRYYLTLFPVIDPTVAPETCSTAELSNRPIINF